jgi:hypothetical protein
MAAVQPVAQNRSAKPASSRRWLAIIGWLTAWGWAIFGCGAGLYLMFTRGPLPLTNGWFILFSGVAACPLTATLWQKLFDRRLSADVRLAAALFFILAGRVALLIGNRVPWLSR